MEMKILVTDLESPKVSERVVVAKKSSVRNSVYRLTSTILPQKIKRLLLIIGILLFTIICVIIAIIAFLFVQKPKDVCNPNPCQSNGKCSKANDKYDCNCTGTGHQGEHCEKDIDECEDEGCVHVKKWVKITSDF